jgi:hypothetical protein
LKPSPGDGDYLLMDSNIEHQFEMERTRREVMACSDLDYMRQITLSVLDLMEGQRQFFIDHLLGHNPYGL